jgi:hypothetical protein
LNIPQNKVVFYDFIYKKCQDKLWWYWKITNFALQYKEENVGNQLFFNALFFRIGRIGKNYHGHYEYDANG